ncbi:MAG: 2-amino-4-hydroxy-6-hydroxymethyldihydropteridine diphosphokinase [Thermoanaerobaculia bacterium]|nr:2-amino-4-hydroxy-6-hydroxymethyldihydropteridine diphosphokinase [Thermoanaerobaculia bacterium]
MTISSSLRTRTFPTTRSKRPKGSSKKRKTSTTTRSSPARRRFALGLGSNLGDSRRILEGALARLEEALGPLVVAPLYLTEPVSPIPQPPYLNTVAIGESDLAAPDLLAVAQRIELEFGRERGFSRPQPPRPDGPRTLDLDLLLLGDEVRAGAAPLLPHPRMRARRFVLSPLCDVAPDWRIPPDGATARELLQQLPESPWARRLPDPLRPAAAEAPVQR